MTPIKCPPAGPGLLPKSSFQLLLDALQSQGYRVMGQRLRDGAVKWDSFDGGAIEWIVHYRLRAIQIMPRMSPETDVRMTSAR